MLIKNQIYEAVITDYTSEGQGVAHIEGCAVFIPNAIAGETVKVRIELVRKTWAAGKITEILEKSPHRVNRECPVAKLCGGCDFWHMDYEEESRLKAERVKNCLNRLGGASRPAGGHRGLIVCRRPPFLVPLWSPGPLPLFLWHSHHLRAAQAEHSVPSAL